MFKHLLAVAFVLVCFSCHQKTTIVVHETHQDTGTYIPLKDYLLGELSGLDSLQVSPLYTVTKNNRTDSTWKKISDIRAFCNPFLIKGTDNITLKKFFSASAFLDRGINAITLSYDPISNLPDSIILRHCDIYIDPVTQTIKRLYMVVKKANSDKGILQLTWKPGSSATISTIDSGTSANEVQQERMTWNFDNENE